MAQMAQPCPGLEKVDGGSKLGVAGGHTAPWGSAVPAVPACGPGALQSHPRPNPLPQPKLGLPSQQSPVSLALVSMRC